MNYQSVRPTAAIVCLCFIYISIFNCSRSENNTTPAGDITPQTITTESGIEMVFIPGGWFEMGSDNGSADETPKHNVWIDTFLMDKYEVTQEQLRRLEISNPSRFLGEKLPVEQITWTEAVIFCNDRSYQEGLEPCYDEETYECNFQANGYRLPTEAEWEYACRSGSKMKYFFGADPRQLKSYTWYGDNAAQKTHKTGTKKPNPWDLYDMYGNVAEWCNDYFAEDYYRNSTEKNPRGPDNGELRVVRGGAWNSSAESCRSAYRTGSASIDDDCLVSDAIGFRCVRKAPDNK